MSTDKMRYVGHESQLFGIEEHRLVGGKGDGMRIFEVNNGCGLEMTVCPDRNGDISRLRVNGINLGYMSPCGYVAPAYYESYGSNWLKSFKQQDEQNESRGEVILPA